MKEKYYNAIVNGVSARNFPHLPVDYGYRDSKNFWYTRFRNPKPVMLPVHERSISPVRYAADHIDDKIKFTEEAYAKLIKVPRVFLNKALKGCVCGRKKWC